VLDNHNIKIKAAFGLRNDYSIKKMNSYIFIGIEGSGMEWLFLIFSLVTTHIH
jgi:hypothetical protein